MKPRAAPTVRPAFTPSLPPRVIRVGRKRIARLMSQAGLAGVSRRRFVTTTVRDGGRQAPDLVERNFTAEAPDGCGSPTSPTSRHGQAFSISRSCSMRISRRIVGWSMATTLAKQLVLDALNMALATRRPRQRDPSLRPGFAGRTQMVVATR